MELLESGDPFPFTAINLLYSVCWVRDSSALLTSRDKHRACVLACEVLSARPPLTQFQISSKFFVDYLPTLASSGLQRRGMPLTLSLCTLHRDCLGVTTPGPMVKDLLKCFKQICRETIARRMGIAHFKTKSKICHESLTDIYSALAQCCAARTPQQWHDARRIVSPNQYSGSC